LGGSGPSQKEKNYISPVSEEQRNKKGLLMKLQKYCSEQGFCQQRQPFPSDHQVILNLLAILAGYGVYNQAANCIGQL
jgi:hypothetical protein